MVGAPARIPVHLAALLLGGCAVLWAAGVNRQEDRDKVQLIIKVSPVIAFSPARVSAVAELKGAPLPEDEAALYCATVEWDWGDGTTSEASLDCEPYEAGKSELKRRYTAQHTYEYAGRYSIRLRLKRQNRTVLSASSSVQIRPGIRDFGGE